MTPHIESKKEEIGKTVIMPGDPMRAKLIAEKYLKNYQLVNQVRGMYAYTGYYNDKLVTVMASGMGMPSIGIYAYELYKFYDVETIIRVGTCGAYSEKINIFDIILANKAYTTSNYSMNFASEQVNEVTSDIEINRKIKTTAESNKINIKECNIITNDCFDAYIDLNKYLNQIPNNFKPEVAEMEAFALFYIAKKMNRKAACLLTVVDSLYNKQSVSSKEREQSVLTMVELALKAV